METYVNIRGNQTSDAELVEADFEKQRDPIDKHFTAVDTIL